MDSLHSAQNHIDETNQINNDDDISLAYVSEDHNTDCGYSTCSSISNIHRSVCDLNTTNYLSKRYYGRRASRLQGQIYELAAIAGISIEQIPPRDMYSEMINSNKHSVLSQLFKNPRLMFAWSKFMLMTEEDQHNFLLKYKNMDTQRKLAKFSNLSLNSSSTTVDYKMLKLIIRLIHTDKLKLETLKNLEESIIDFFKSHQIKDNVAFSVKLDNLSDRISFAALCQHYGLEHKVLGDCSNFIILGNQQPIVVDTQLSELLENHTKTTKTTISK
ncbi:hypothetical protein GJ496_007595 [Pomphorhynchus laevis]|nr:hypothetical protein GJ496_007595 [Pomphorhynchus laevis]